jgi:phenylacetate-coenzyme A ligase PaaK-like adenylate-forming protein
MFAVPLREVVRIHASTCMSVVVGYTRNDIKTWSDLMARVLVAGGVSKDDVVQIAFGWDEPCASRGRPWEHCPCAWPCWAASL